MASEQIQRGQAWYFALEREIIRALHEMEYYVLNDGVGVVATVQHCRRGIAAHL